MANIFHMPQILKILNFNYEDISTNHDLMNLSITRLFIEQPRLHLVC